MKAASTHVMMGETIATMAQEIQVCMVPLRSFPEMKALLLKTLLPASPQSRG